MPKKDQNIFILLLCMLLVMIGGCDDESNRANREEIKASNVVEGKKDSSKTKLKEYMIKIGDDEYNLCSSPDQAFSGKSSIQKVVDEDKEGFPVNMNKVFLNDGSVFTYQVDLNMHIFNMQFKHSDMKTNWKFNDSIAFGSSFEDTRNLLGEPIAGKKLKDEQYQYVFYTRDNQTLEFKYKEDKLVEMNIGKSDIVKERESDRKTCPENAEEVDLRSDYALIHMPLKGNNSDFKILLEKDDILSLHSISDLENEGWKIINEENLVLEKNHDIKLTMNDSTIQAVKFAADANIQVNDMEIQEKSLYTVLEKMGRPDKFQLPAAGVNGYFGYTLENGYIQFELNNKAQISGGEIIYDKVQIDE